MAGEVEEQWVATVMEERRSEMEGMAQWRSGGDGE